jgi:curved DNA-binding protein CbpA
MDAFATLGLPRTAALDEELLKTAYSERCRLSHPDQASGDETQAAELNAALEILSAPEKRLKHLLALEAGDQAAWKTVPLDAAMMDLFSKIGPFLQNLTAHAKKKETAASALAKALLSNAEMKLQEQAESLGGELSDLRTALEAELPPLDQKRQTGDTEVFSELHCLQAKLAYVAKWQAQIREAFLTLA